MNVEANAAGVPVIAYRGGGALETIIDGETGLFFDDQTVESLVETIKRFETLSFDASACLRRAKKFSEEEFEKNIKGFVEGKLKEKG